MLPYSSTENLDCLYGELAVGGSPVTLHVILATGDRKGFVWISDQLVGAYGGYATIEKVAYFSHLGIATSIWGDSLAMFVRDAIVEKVRRREAPLGDKGMMKLFLQDVAAEVIREHRPQNLQSAPRGMLLAIVGETPQLWSLTVHHPPMANPVASDASFGDDSNPALFFMHRYYGLSTKTIPEILSIAVHTARMAALMNTKGIRGVDAWVCEGNEMRQLKDEELAPHIQRSNEIDSLIHGRLSESDDLAVDKAKFDALLGKMIATSPTPLDEVKSPKKRKPKKSAE